MTVQIQTVTFTFLRQPQPESLLKVPASPALAFFDLAWQDSPVPSHTSGGTQQHPAHTFN